MHRVFAAGSGFAHIKIPGRCPSRGSCRTPVSAGRSQVAGGTDPTLLLPWWSDGIPVSQCGSEGGCEGGWTRPCSQPSEAHGWVVACPSACSHATPWCHRGCELASCEQRAVVTRTLAHCYPCRGCATEALRVDKNTLRRHWPAGSVRSSDISLHRQTCRPIFFLLPTRSPRSSAILRLSPLSETHSGTSR